MRVALEVWSNDLGQVESTCRLAEELGFDALYFGESPHDLNLECWTTLAALARSTDRIRLGPVIANILPGYRSTAFLARQAAGIATISGDRFDFRTGVGAAAEFGRAWWEPFGVSYPGYSQRLSETRAAVGALTEWWSTGPLIPITIAATGRRAMELAATSADVWESSFATPAEFTARNDDMTALVGDRSVVRSLEIDGFLSGSEDGMKRLIERVTVERGANEDLDAIFSRALLGTPTRAAERLRELANVGVDQVVVALHDPHDPDALGALAETVAESGTRPN